MNISKKLENDILFARQRGDIDGYCRAKKTRAEVSPFDKYRYKLFIDLINNHDTLGNVIDIGCDIGVLEPYYEKKSKSLVLFDLDLFSLRCARSFNKSIVNKTSFLSGDISKLPFKTGSFDTVIALEVIEHLPKETHRAILDGIIRILKKGATIYISTPNSFSLAGLEGKVIELLSHKYKWNAWDPTHEYIYNAFEFIDFLKSFGGLKIKKVTGSYFLPGSLVVRLPLSLQNMLGAFSYLISRFVGFLPPFKWLGFTTFIEAEKE